MIKSLFKHNILLLTILIIGVFFRIYNAPSFFSYGHEQDLQAWIVKDIVVDHHFRLIGQETSITGVFIGPLYYYLLIPFFLIFNMDSIGSVLLVAIISALTLVSIYFVLKQLFSRQTALIGSFLYASSVVIAFLDRWAVPTQLTLLWTIWFFYVCFSILKKRSTVMPILIILIGLIWHVHVAFIPLLILIPIALLLSGNLRHFSLKEVSRSQLIISIGIFLLQLALLLPLK